MVAQQGEAHVGFNRQTLDVNGVRLNVIVEGQGPDVLLVHGFPDDHTVWRHQIPALVAAGYRVIAPDTRGNGESSVPPRVADYDIERLVADLVGVLDALGVQKARVVAHDWGSIQGWYLAFRHPERVERYIPLSVGHPQAYRTGGLKQMLKGYYVGLIQLRGVIEFFVRLFNWLPFRVLLGYASEFPHIKARLVRPGRLTAGFNYYRANLRQIFSSESARVQAPVVGIWSDGDRFLTEAQMVNSERFCDGGWKYVRVEGANHWLQLDAPARVNSLLLEHLG